MSLAAVDHPSFLHLGVQDRIDFRREPTTSSGLFIANYDFAVSPFSTEAIGSARASGGSSDHCSASGSGLFIAISERFPSTSSPSSYTHYHLM